MRLTILSPESLSGRTHDFDQPEVVIGRARTAGLRLQLADVSRSHAVIRRAPRGGGDVVEDLDSRSGTLLNGEPVREPRRLHGGDVLRLGVVELRYERPGRLARLGLVGWWRTASAAVISVGAVAGAVVSLVSFWPDPDPADIARFTSVQVTTTQMPLSEYRRRVTTHAVPDDAGHPADRVSLALVPDPDPAATGDPDPDPATGPAPDATGDPEPGSTTGPAPDPSGGPGAGADRRKAGPSPVTTDAGGGTSRVNDPAAAQPLREEVDDRTADEAANRAGSEALADGLIVEKSPAVVDVLRNLAPVVTEDGRPVDAVTAAERIVEVLKDSCRRVPDGSGGSTVSEPLGAVVRADVELQGMRDRTVALSWSMWERDGGGRLHGDWLNDNLAYRLRAGTEHDTTSLDLWVPLPRETGPYVIRTTLRVDGVAIAGSETEPFD